MFKECKYEANIDKYILVDDDFEFEFRYPYDTIKSSSRAVHITYAIVDEYKKRKLNIGQNIALFIIWYYHVHGLTFKYTTDIQDLDCSKIIKNWTKIQKSRNKYLKKLLAWS